MNYGAQLKKIRRFLRDPNGNIWDNTYLRTSFNDIQREIQHSIGFLEKVEALRVPPFYQMSYMFEWEWRHLPSTQNRYYQCLRQYQQGAYAFCNRWEAQVDYGTTGGADEPGSHYTHPWEAWYIDSGDVVKIKFPDDFYAVKIMAYDYTPLEYIEKKRITLHDSNFQTKSGEPIGYYREDTLNNDFILYPRPSSVVWNDVVDPQDPDYIYTFDWETDYSGGIGQGFTREDTTNSREYIFIWEDDIGSDSDYGMRGMYLFELGIESTGQYGMVLYVEGETTEPFGTFESRTGTIFNQDEGIAVDVIDADDNVLLVYDSMAKDIQDDQDESDFPELMQKYIECGTLERAYGTNTDGRIGSLREYWGFRYQVGVEMAKRYMRKRRQDRDYRLTTSSLPVRRRYRHPRLPDTYPNT